MNEFSRFTDRLHLRNDGKQRKHDSFLFESDITINNGQISSSVSQFCFVYVINEQLFFQFSGEVREQEENETEMSNVS